MAKSFLATLLKTYRKLNHLTQLEMADLLTMGRRTYQRLERDERQAVANEITRIVKATGIDLSILLSPGTGTGSGDDSMHPADQPPTADGKMEETLRKDFRTVIENQKFLIESQKALILLLQQQVKPLA